MINEVDVQLEMAHQTPGPTKPPCSIGSST